MSEILELLFEENGTAVDNLYEDKDINLSGVQIFKNDSFYNIQGQLTNKGENILKNLTLVWNVYYKSRGCTFLAENLKISIEYMLPGDIWKFRSHDFKSALGANPIAVKFVEITKE